MAQEVNYLELKEQLFEHMTVVDIYHDIKKQASPE
jgi:hypothetical protein